MKGLIIENAVEIQQHLLFYLNIKTIKLSGHNKLSTSRLVMIV